MPEILGSFMETPLERRNGRPRRPVFGNSTAKRVTSGRGIGRYSRRSTAIPAVSGFDFKRLGAAGVFSASMRRASFRRLGFFRRSKSENQGDRGIQHDQAHAQKNRSLHRHVTNPQWQAEYWQ